MYIIVGSPEWGLQFGSCADRDRRLRLHCVKTARESSLLHCRPIAIDLSVSGERSSITIALRSEMRATQSNLWSALAPGKQTGLKLHIGGAMSSSAFMIEIKSMLMKTMTRLTDGWLKLPEGAWLVRPRMEFVLQGCRRGCQWPPLKSLIIKGVRQGWKVTSPWRRPTMRAEV